MNTIIYRIDLFKDLLTGPQIDLKELQQNCFQGVPENREIKAKCWKILLGYLPLETDRWEEHLHTQRNLYSFYINLLFQNPDNEEPSAEGSVDHFTNSQRNRHLSVKYSKTPRVDKKTFQSKQTNASLNPNSAKLDLKNTKEETSKKKHQRVVSVPNVHKSLGSSLPQEIDFKDGNIMMQPLGALFSDEEEEDSPETKKKATYFQDNDVKNNKQTKKTKSKTIFDDDSDDDAKQGTKDYLFDSDNENEKEKENEGNNDNNNNNNNSNDNDTGQNEKELNETNDETNDNSNDKNETETAGKSETNENEKQKEEITDSDDKLETIKTEETSDGKNDESAENKPEVDDSNPKEKEAQTEAETETAKVE